MRTHHLAEKVSVKDEGGEVTLHAGEGDVTLGAVERLPDEAAAAEAAAAYRRNPAKAREAVEEGHDPALDIPAPWPASLDKT